MEQNIFYNEHAERGIHNKYVDLMSNAGFKAVFGDENNKELVIKVLNQMLPGERHVEDITYLKTEYQGTLLKNKEYHYDFMCRDSSGRSFIVEMQCYPEQYWFRRCVSYCCRAYDRQSSKGEDNIGHPDEQEWKDRYVSEYTFREKTTHDLLDETIFIIFAELARFHKTLEECQSPQDKLFYLFKNIWMMEDADENWITDDFWEAFFNACEIAAFSEEKRIKYEQEMYDERRLQGELGASMEIGMKKGLAEGLEKGRAEGLAEGRAEGRAEGEENAKIATARRMLTKGMPIELTAEISGLSVERVMEL